MPTTAEGHISTDRASRYLAQLSSHLNHMGHMRDRSGEGGHGGNTTAQRPTVEHVDTSDTDGQIRFAGGVCTLHATPDALTVRVDADDEDTLRQLQTGLTKRIEKIGRRDGLTVTWRRTDAGAVPGARSAHETHPRPETRAAKPWWRRARPSTLGLAALVVLVIVVHVGLFGGALGFVDRSGFGEWGLGVVVVLVLLKVLLGGAHLVGGGYLLRRRRRGQPLLPGRGMLRHLPLRHLPLRHSPRGHMPSATGSPAPDQTVAETSDRERA